MTEFNSKHFVFYTHNPYAYLIDGINSFLFVIFLVREVSSL